MEMGRVSDCVQYRLNKLSLLVVVLSGYRLEGREGDGRERKQGKRDGEMGRKEPLGRKKGGERRDSHAFHIGGLSRGRYIQDKPLSVRCIEPMLVFIDQSH